jgi:hypothetical protein
MHAECPGESGSGYYAAGPRPDVQDVPVEGEAVPTCEVVALSVVLAMIAL